VAGFDVVGPEAFDVVRTGLHGAHEALRAAVFEEDAAAEGHLVGVLEPRYALL
jgi:hypothetical protein